MLLWALGQAVFPVAGEGGSEGGGNGANHASGFMAKCCQNNLGLAFIPKPPCVNIHRYPVCPSWHGIPVDYWRVKFPATVVLPETKEC